MKYRRSAKYRSMWFSVLETYGVNCAYCHVVPATQIDHVIPVSYIENHTLANLRPSCSWCNLLAGSKVFETFEDKYEWMRLERLSKRRFRNRRTICTTCRLPYQVPMHSPSIFLCSECYDYEYEKQTSKSRAWREWIDLLKTAEINVKCHREFAKAVRNIDLPKQAKDRLFGTIYSSFLGEQDQAILAETISSYEAAPVGIKTNEILYDSNDFEE